MTTDQTPPPGDVTTYFSMLGDWVAQRHDGALLCPSGWVLPTDDGDRISPIGFATPEDAIQAGRLVNAAEAKPDTIGVALQALRELHALADMLRPLEAAEATAKAIQDARARAANRASKKDGLAAMHGALGELAHRMANLGHLAKEAEARGRYKRMQGLEGKVHAVALVSLRTALDALKVSSYRRTTRRAVLAAALASPKAYPATRKALLAAAQHDWPQREPMIAFCEDVLAGEGTPSAVWGDGLWGPDLHLLGAVEPEQ